MSSQSDASLGFTVNAGHAASIKASLEGLPGLGPQADLTLSPDALRRQQLALRALPSTDGLEAAWSDLAVSAAAASRITGLLTDHDKTTAEAAAAWVRCYNARGQLDNLHRRGLDPPAGSFVEAIETTSR